MFTNRTTATKSETILNLLHEEAKNRSRQIHKHYLPIKLHTPKLNYNQGDVS